MATTSGDDGTSDNDSSFGEGVVHDNFGEKVWRYRVDGDPRSPGDDTSPAGNR